MQTLNADILFGKHNENIFVDHTEADTSYLPIAVRQWLYRLGSLWSLSVPASDQPIFEKRIDALEKELKRFPIHTFTNANTNALDPVARHIEAMYPYSNKR